jgi:hypothetical protein
MFSEEALSNCCNRCIAARGRRLDFVNRNSSAMHRSEGWFSPSRVKQNSTVRDNLFAMRIIVGADAALAVSRLTPQ